MIFWTKDLTLIEKILTQGAGVYSLAFFLFIKELLYTGPDQECGEPI